MLAFVQDGAGISATGTGGDGASGSDVDGKAAMGGVLALDPELLSVLEEKGTEALVVAFVEGGDVDSIPGWAEATKGLQGEVSECVGRRPRLLSVLRTNSCMMMMVSHRFWFVRLAEPSCPRLAFFGMVWF